MLNLNFVESPPHGILDHSGDVLNSSNVIPSELHGKNSFFFLFWLPVPTWPDCPFITMKSTWKSIYSTEIGTIHPTCSGLVLVSFHTKTHCVIFFLVSPQTDVHCSVCTCREPGLM